MQTEYPPNTPWQPAQQQQYPAMPPQPPAPQPGMVWLPPVANDRSGLRIVGGLIVFYALLMGFLYTASYLGNVQPDFVGLGELLFILILPGLFYGIRFFIQAQRWNVINQRRQTAVAWGSASGVPLAEPQPFPNIEALPLPFTIKLRRNWPAIFALFCFLVVLVSSLQANLYSAGNNISFQQVIVDWITNPSSFWSVDVCLIAFCIVWGSLPQSIEVTAQGLIIRHPMYDWFKTANGPFWKWVIPWSDIRLFAIREGKPGASKVRYELSSPLKVVTFSRIVRPRWWSLYRPAQPFGEYNAQMDALLALISARTGLLLYDVR
jgi:hypothetical protein